jgi:lauroyl/myristoyl acyltransferase
MAWLSLALFPAWFCVMGALYWWFPRQPRNRRRSVFDASMLLLALVASIGFMLWGYHMGATEVAEGLWGRRSWPCCMPTAASWR